MAAAGRSFYFRVGGVIVLCTLLLTASFVGVLAVITGAVSAFDLRIPWYLLAAAAFFVGSIVVLEGNDVTGREVILTALLAGLLGGASVALGLEGVLFTLENPADVFGSQLLLYFLAAGLVGTGIGYWALNHWREFSRQEQGQL